MKKIVSYLLVVFVALNLYNCTEKDTIPNDIEVQNFVWKAMNLYYLWQDDVPDLQDDRFINQTELNTYLKNKTPEELFENLKSDQDRFSWMVDDYIALENLFAGITKNNGMEFGLVAVAEDSNDVFGYVRYVLPNSSAEENGVERGDIFYGINGQALTRDNYKELLFSDNDTYTVDFADYAVVSGQPVITPNNLHTTLTKEEINENPVKIAQTYTIDGEKIGYLMYNQFVINYDNDLNNAFLQFKNENISNLVLDLRYNGGGSVNTAVSLCGMITGQFNGELLATQNFNSKLQPQFEANSEINFRNRMYNGSAINSLNLTKLYVLVSGSTASASEFIINNLSPYIDVVLIGTKTVGKSVASFTLYDSDNYTKNNVNPNHKYALQLIALEIKNKLGENTHTGFIPDTILPENYTNLGVLGDVNEPLFAEAIAQITATRRPTNNLENIKLPLISNSKKYFTQNNMYINLK